MAQVKQPQKSKALSRRHAKGDGWVWMSATGMVVTMLMLMGLVLLVSVNGFSALWPRHLTQFALADGTRALGEVTRHDEAHRRLQIKSGNRDIYGIDFKWIELDGVSQRTQPADAFVLERLEHGHFFGYLKDLHLLGHGPVDGDQLPAAFQAALGKMADKREELRRLEDEIATINRRYESLRLAMIDAGDDLQRVAQLLEQQQQKKAQFESLRDKVDAFRIELLQQKVVMSDCNQETKEIPLFSVLRAYQPNQMGGFSRMGLYLKRMLELITEPPREANTEGGLFPAIFGTAMMVIIMSLFTMPLGVVAAVYLREYAKDGFLVRLIRITVNNLAGVPSIVYGIFGLGFFVYGVGGTIDEWFFSSRLPTPTFGTGGLLWASLTMALLTMPVVIVATEEGLSAVPKGLREGSYALGATKLQTLLRVVLPMSSPGILTGLILSIARAAGEVAPLMLVGVAKLAANLAVDGVYPYFHPERKFMHLGFHIYDVGFQSPNVEAAIPMVFVTTLLLLFMVLGLSSAAMVLRQRMRTRYSSGAF